MIVYRRTDTEVSIYLSLKKICVYLKNFTVFFKLEKYVQYFS